MSVKIAHISDVHFRSLKRHEEYKIVFKKLFKKLSEESVDLIFIGGDIVHSKTQGITPEIIDLLNIYTSHSPVADPACGGGRGLRGGGTPSLKKSSW